MSHLRYLCINCNQPKADERLAEPYCGDCQGVLETVRKEADEKQWGNALYAMARQNALNSRAPQLGMQSKMDPRTVTDRISTEALQRRLAG